MYFLRTFMAHRIDVGELLLLGDVSRCLFPFSGVGGFFLTYDNLDW